MGFSSWCAWRTDCKQRNSLISKTIPDREKCWKGNKILWSVSAWEETPSHSGEASVRRWYRGKANPTEGQGGTKSVKLELEWAWLVFSKDKKAAWKDWRGTHYTWVRDPARALSCRALWVLVGLDFLPRVTGCHCRASGASDIKSLHWTDSSCCWLEYRF